MDPILFKLVTSEYLSTGIFGTLEKVGGSLSFHTLEHAYPVQPESSSVGTTYAPKIPRGQIFQCVRGTHQLDGMIRPFVTFEIKGVEGHSGLLFHRGNWNADSDGCVLLGMLAAPPGEPPGVYDSARAFELFMKSVDGLDEFYLEVT